MLGAAYLESGRFQSAAKSFGDALELGDNDPRTVLSFALAKTATGDNNAALNTLKQWQRDLDPADLGLALALAGAPERGVHVLTNAIRGGQNTAKVRQNLAYTYALAGNWRGARIMPALEEQDRDLGEQLRNTLLALPNVLDPSVPDGESEDDNVFLREWGAKPEFAFEPKEHADIAPALGMRRSKSRLGT